MVLALAFFTLAGCHEAGHIDLPGNYGSAANEIVGEVIDVDNRSREIEIRADSGRTSMVRYDNNTQVLYRQRTYPVTNLERGDYVAARVQQDRDGRYTTNTITVRESVQDRGGTVGARPPGSNRRTGRVCRQPPRHFRAARFAQSAGRRRGRLQCTQAVTDRFNRLRNGDQVRIEGRSVSADRFELESFL